MPEDRNLVLTHSQAACLIALRHGNETQPKIAMKARLALSKASATLRMLARLGLAEQDGMRRAAERPAASTPFRIDRRATTGFPALPGVACSNCWIDP